MDLNIQHDKKTHKFFAIVDGKECVMQYTVLNDKTLEYYHTFVPPELRGHQIAEKIVIAALEYAKENNYHVDPTCPFVARIIERHPQYKSLIAKK